MTDRLWTAIEGCEPFITKIKSATRLQGIRPLVRFTAAMRMLVCGDCADRMDYGLQLSESVTSDALKRFCRLVVEKFDSYVNKCPSDAKKEQIIQFMAKRGFPGCFGSCDCKHYFWLNCPIALAGQCKAKEGGKMLAMEEICDPFLYIWYFICGHPGSLNDINVLDRSKIVGSLIRGEFDNRVPPYNINGKRQDWIYFLADGVYPCWSIFVKRCDKPHSEAEIKCSKRQEHVRKDIERCFGVLVKKSGILKNHLRGWYASNIKQLVDCCVIIHNMTQEVRMTDYTFKDQIEPVNNNEEEEEVQSIFFNEENQVGNNT